MAINRIPYRIGLRVLGQLLNGEKARMVTVCEIDQGFLLHYFAKGDPGQVCSRAIHGAEVLDLDDVFRGQRGKAEPSGSFKGLPSIFGFRHSEALRFQKSHPLCPMGYESVLRAVGDVCDRRSAQAVTITELDDCLHVEYTVDRVDFVLRDGQRLALPGRRSERYTAAQVAELVQRSREQIVENVRRSGQTLSFNPMDVTAYLDAAQAIEDDGEYRNAEELYRMAAQLAPRHAETHYHLARHARRRGDRKAALKCLERAIALRDDDGRFFHLLGRINTERHHYDAAVQALEHAIVCDPDNAVYHFDLSRVYERLGRTEDARAVLARRGAGASVQASLVAELWEAGHEETSPPPASVASAPEAAHTSFDANAVAEAAHQQVQQSIYTPAPWASDPAATWLSDGQAAGASQSPFAGEFPTPTASTADLVVSPSDDPTALASAESAWPDALEPADAALNPFGAEAPAWETLTDASHSAPARGADMLAPAAEFIASTSFDGLALPQAATATPQMAEASEDAGADSLPLLGLSLADEWPASPAAPLGFAADGAAAGEALSLAVPPSWEAATLPATAAPFPATALPETSEPLPLTATEDAVQLAAAIMRAEEMVRAEPERADLHRKLGFLLAKQGRNEEAAAEFRRAVECGRHKLPE